MADIDYKTPEDVADEKARKKAGKAYDTAMPEADTTTGKLKGQSIMDSIRKYSPNQAAEVDESEATTKKYVRLDPTSRLPVIQTAALAQR